MQFPMWNYPICPLPLTLNLPSAAAASPASVFVRIVLTRIKNVRAIIRCVRNPIFVIVGSLAAHRPGVDTNTSRSVRARTPNAR